MLAKFREHKTFAKKLSKALGRGDYGDAKRLELYQKPVVTLDHIVKERYPTFTDALRDLDDALSMLFLFANLPTNHNLPPATVATCERLANEWQHYVIRTNVLRKSFLSIKGIYYQAEVQGQDVLWLVPYKFAQNVPVDVDFRIMHTFVEFYTTLLGFVLFKLYTNEGLVYPPKFDKDADSNGAGLRAFKLENKGIGQLSEAEIVEGKKQTKKETVKQTKLLQAKIAAITEGEEEDTPMAEDKPEDVDAFDTFKPIKTDSAVDVLPQPQISHNGTGDVDPSNLFSPFTFYLSRETPREPIEFLLRSFGCKRIGWDLVLGEGSFTDNELDPSITHQIVDRPPVVGLPPVAAGGTAAPRLGGRVAGRTYVQPQYVWDCVNAGRLIAPADYAPGALLPPHLSPWVKVSAGGYDPTMPIPNGQEEDVEESDAESDNGMAEAGDDDEVDEEMADEVDVSEGEEESEDEEELARIEHQKELEAEAAGVKLPAADSKKTKKKSKAQKEEEEQKEMQKIMMTKKKRKLYEKMIYGNQKKQDEADNLRDKRRKLEKSKKKAATA